MKDIQAETNCAYLFIAHDLSMVKYISDRIGVLHRGYLVETGTRAEIFSDPLHPYTKSLLSAVPHPNPRLEKNRQILSYNWNEGEYEQGSMKKISDTHFVLASPGVRV